MPDVNATSLDGTDLTLAAREVEALAAELRGDLLRSEHPRYDDARALWNGMIDRRPALIAQCLGVADVVTCVDFARAHGIRLSIRGGGHNIAGLALADGALTIDTRRMRGVRVDPTARRASVQAGCLLGDVDRETQLYGLAAVLGFVSETGVAGLTLGGGFGYLTRRFGWTSDTVTGFEVVTPDGSVVRASADRHSDLFWALRGGGGNFGVVTRFEYELFPVGPEIVGGAVAWRAEEASEVLELFHRTTADAPPEHASVVGLRIAPPAPWLSAEVHGTPIVALFVCDTGSRDEAQARADEIRSLGSPVGDTLGPRSYVSQQSLLDATQPKGRRYYWKSEYLPDIGPDLFAACRSALERITSPHSAILLSPLGGKLNTLPETHSAVGNRDTEFVINFAAAWDDPAEDDRHIAWAREGWEAVRPFSTGGTYVNFLTDDEHAPRIRDAYRDNYRRLAEVKREVDPGNLLRANKNIPPAAS